MDQYSYFRGLLLIAAMMAGNLLAETPDQSPNQGGLRVDIQSDSRTSYATAVQATGDNSSVNEALSRDGEILSRAQALIQSKYSRYMINVRAYGGVVRLTGTVDSKNDKQEIEREIRNIPGVKEISNQLTVKSS